MQILEIYTVGQSRNLSQAKQKNGIGSGKYSIPC